MLWTRGAEKVPLFQQIFAQGQPGPGDAGLDGALLHPQQGGNLPIGEALQLPENQHLPVLLRQGPQARPQGVPQLLLLRLAVGTVPLVGQLGLPGASSSSRETVMDRVLRRFSRRRKSMHTLLVSR